MYDNDGCKERAWKNKHPKRRYEITKKYRQSHPQKVSEWNKYYWRIWYQTPKNKIKKRKKDNKWNKTHPEKVKGYQLKYNQTEKAKEKARKYRERHPERLKEIYSKYDHSSKASIKRKRYLKSDKGKVATERFKRKHPRIFADYNRKYHHTGKGLKSLARRWGIIHNFSYEQWMKKIKQTAGICPRCGKYVGMSWGIDAMTLDHNPPVSKVPKGFIYTIDMVRPLCWSCNSSKCNKIE
jgi:hypothetical protein